MHHCRSRAVAGGLPHMRWLEVGAGDGRLSAHLHTALQRLDRLREGPGADVELECTDSGQNRLHEGVQCGCAHV